MFKSKTVIVIGAGASAEFNLTVGSVLKDDISRLLKTFSRTDELNADVNIARAIRAAANSGKVTKQALDAAAAKLADGLPHSASIDNYLEMHSDNDALVKVGKIAIWS